MAFGRAEVGARLFSAEAVSWTKEQSAELEEVPDGRKSASNASVTPRTSLFKRGRSL